MANVKLNDAAMKLVEKYLARPADGAPKGLTDLADANWALLTHRLTSDQVKDGPELAVPLFDVAAQSKKAGGAWAMEASLAGNAFLSIDLLSEKDLKAYGFADGVPDGRNVMVAYKAAAALDAAVSGTAKYPAWGGFGVSAGAKAAASLTWFVQASESRTVAQALADAARNFVWPSDLRALMELTQGGDWFGTTVEFAGQAQLGFSVEAAKTGSAFTYNVEGKDVGIGLSFGLKSTFKAERSGTYRLSILSEVLDGTLGLRVRLDDTGQTRRSGTFGLTAGADFSAVAASAEKVLRGVLPALDNVLLDKLVQPGQALKGVLADLIEHKLEGDLADLALLLVGSKPAGTLKASLVEKLTGDLVDVIDGAYSAVLGGAPDAQALASGWVRQAVGRISALGLKDPAPVRAVMEAALTKVADQLEAAKKELVGKIQGKAEAEVTAVLASLGKLGGQFEGVLDRLDANAASVSLKRALEKYAEERKRILDFLTDANRQKIELALASEWSRTTGSSAVFEVWFRPGVESAGAEALFQAILAGQLTNLGPLTRAAGSAVADAKGWLQATGEAMSQGRSNLNFFGMSFVNALSWQTKLSIRTDLVTGELLAAEQGAQIEDVIKNRWKNRTVSFAARFAYADGQFSPALIGGFSLTREKSDRNEFQHLVDAYADGTGTPRANIGNLLPVPTDPAKEVEFWRNLTLSIPFTLSGEDWTKLSQLDEVFIDTLSTGVSLKRFATEYGDDEVENLRDHIKSVFGIKKPSDAHILAFLKKFAQGPVSITVAEDNYRELGYNEIGLAARGALRPPGIVMYRRYHRLAGVTLAPSRLRAMAREAERLMSDPALANRPGVLREALLPIGAQLVRALWPVTLVSDTVTGKGWFTWDEGVKWPFVAFVTTMGRLLDKDPPYFMPLAKAGDAATVSLL